MKQWKMIAWGCLAWSVVTSCAPEPTSVAPTKPDSTAVTAPAQSEPGNRLKVYTIGYPVKGVPSTEWELYEEFVYDTAGHEVEYIAHYDAFGKRVRTDYDAQGYPRLVTQTYGTKAQREEFRSSWNADHTEQITEEFSQEDGRVVGKVVRRYDQAGQLVGVDEEDMHLPDYHTQHKTRIIYDAKGRRSEERESVGDREIIGTQYRYDALGNLVEIKHNDAEGKTSQIESFTFSSEGRKLARYLEDYSAYITARQLTKRYEYDGKGRVVKEIQFGGQCDAAGEQAGKCSIVETITWTYDDQDRMLTETRDLARPKPSQSRKRFEYAGQVTTQHP